MLAAVARAPELADRGGADAVQRRGVGRRAATPSRVELLAEAHRAVADRQPAPAPAAASSARASTLRAAAGRERARRRSARAAARPGALVRGREHLAAAGVDHRQHAALAPPLGAERRRARAPAGSRRRRARAASDCASPRAVATPTRRPGERAGAHADGDRASTALQATPASREQLARQLEQPRRVSRVRARRRVVARSATMPVGQAQRDRGGGRGRVEAEHDHRGPPSPDRSIAPVRSAPALAQTSTRRAVARRRWLSVTRRRAPASSACAVLGPLHERDPARAEIVGEQVRVLALETREPVQVEVRDGHARRPA